MWGHRYRLGRREDARVVSDKVWTTFCVTYLCPLDMLRLCPGCHFHFIKDCSYVLSDFFFFFIYFYYLEANYFTIL